MNIQSISVRAVAVAFVLVLGSMVAFSIPTPSYATVGGPTYTYSFTYNPANESVYFVKDNQGGKGCPPELWKMSLNTGKSDVVFSCDQGVAVSATNYDAGTDPVYIAINAIVKNFKDLTPIQLSKNAIAIDVNFVASETSSPTDDFVARSRFNAVVYQDAKKIAEVPIVGCSADQPFVFAGYAVPGLEKKIVLLLSTKGDCFEGGYINETLYTVSNISLLDRTHSDWPKLSAVPLVPSAATLVVFERDGAPGSGAPAETKPTDMATTTASMSIRPQDRYPLIPLVAVGTLAALVGFGAGALVFRNRKDVSVEGN